MHNYIQITAAYSNAVLVAILPHISDFCHKLELPVQIPISVKQVERFNCFDDKKDPGGALTLTNGYTFGFNDGIVSTFRDESRCFSPNSANAFSGRLRMTQTAAIAFARDVITKLGYIESDLYVDGKPIVRSPFLYGTYLIPYYHIKWLDPEGYPCVSMEIDGNNERLTSIELMTKTIWAKSPILNLGSERRNPSAFHDLEPQGSIQLPLLLTEMAHFTTAIEVPLKIPISDDQVADISVDCNGLGVDICLVSGYRFRFYSGQVTHFVAPDAFYVPHLSRHVNAYWNNWNMSIREAEDFARHILMRLGYSKRAFFCDERPMVKKPQKIGVHTIPHYMLTWEHDLSSRKGDPIVIDSLLDVEIDAGTRTVKQMWIVNSNILQNAATNLGAKASE